jgi:Kef-type K+ transport system membrane component KefB
MATPTAMPSFSGLLIVVGPAVLGWVHVDQAISVISVLGLAFLLFLAGLEIDFPRLRGRILKLTAAGFALSFALALATGEVLKAAGLAESPLLVAAGTIADFGAVILLSIFFITSGVKFDLDALTSSTSSLVMVPIFLSAAEGAALIGAGLLSVLIFPLVGLALLREPAPAPGPIIAT